ncbi:3-oxoacid CoA-transferase subunit B [Cytobacillus sp. IB215665]|uniref:3-oxoacid CoA-transferase subunit B n=1 Tax=Cytobacillus sp. IB215665 TaxID=3097357 RepID=UPI002A13EF49|nr:3-oxoacid CoA-transferase subunit B [Cytobacillus sp. IB215665]MDX8366242.1 3-oxoacid CoA-transferase subunit B [Cytobacillus sp. IB215665]
MGMGIDVRNRIAKRAAEEIKNGMIVNLGIGIPSLVPNHLPHDIHVMFHAENGVLGIGPSPKKGNEDENLCNAAGYPVTVVNGASYCDSAISFGMIRRGYVDLTILGSLQVSQNGDLANWIIPGKKVPGMGGAMELAQKAQKVIVVMSHADKMGQSKILEKCSLPLTSKNCVHMIITDMAVIHVTKDGLLLSELMAPFLVQDVIDKTGALLHLSDNLQVIP